MNDFDTKYKNLLQEYANKVSIPNWFISGIKTLLDRNITIEDWNRMYSYLERMSSDNEVQSKILNLIKEELILKANKENVDSEILFLKNNKADTQYVDVQDEGLSRRIDQNDLDISANTQNVSRLIEHVTSINNSITHLLNRVGTNESEIIKLNDYANDLYLIKVNVGEVYTISETDLKLADKVNTNYLTSNYFNKEQIKEMLGTTSSLTFKIVDSLPTEDIIPTTIYLVPYENEYEEYIYIDNKWEMLGSTKINISEYATKGFVVETVNNANHATKDYVDETINKKSFVGTYTQYDEAYKNGLIAEGCIVCIVDDDVTDSTSAVLGVGKLGYMILGN